MVNLYLIFLKFIICAVLILFAGKRVAKYGDVIAEKTGLGGFWVGLVLVAVATSLPELFTGISSVALVNAPGLAIGNLFGANSYNLLNIALLDILSKGTPILSALSPTQLLTAVLTLIPAMLATLGIIMPSKSIFGISIWNIGICSIAIFISYIITVRFLFKAETHQKKSETSHKEKYADITLEEAYSNFARAALIIIVSGIWLAYIGKELSGILKLNQSFVGSMFMGLATTLPEITVSIAALSIGARDIAVANMLGSNLFNFSIIFVDDIFYRKAPILEAVSTEQIIPASVVMAMTAVIIIAIAIKAKRKFLNISWYVPLLVIIFLAGTYAGFIMGVR